MPGTHAQKVILTAFGLQEPPATTLALALDIALVAEAAGPGAEDDDEPPLHAASSETPAMTGSACRILVLISR
jgi:hypothetical protein